MGSLSFFDPTKVALDFLAIQADNMRDGTLEVGFLRSEEKLKIVRLIVDKEARKALYASERNAPLQELPTEKLQNIGGVRIIF
jgi:hypothetical protein